MAVLAGKLEARREDCAPVAGKSTLNRLEPTRYHKISHNPMAIKRLLVDLFLEAHARAPNEIILDLDATDDPVHGEQEGSGWYDRRTRRVRDLSCGDARIFLANILDCSTKFDREKIVFG